MDRIEQDLIERQKLFTICEAFSDEYLKSFLQAPKEVLENKIQNIDKEIKTYQRQLKKHSAFDYATQYKEEAIRELRGLKGFLKGLICIKEC